MQMFSYSSNKLLKFNLFLYFKMSMNVLQTTVDVNKFVKMNTPLSDVSVIPDF